MKNKLLKLLPFLVSVVSLTACGENELDPARIISAVDTFPIIRANENGETVKINDPDAPENSKLSSLEMNNKVVSLFYKESSVSGYVDEMKLSFTARPYGCSLAGLTWESSNPSVATVNEEGVVKAVSEGTCEVAIKNSDGTISASSHVVVSKDTNSGVSGRAQKILEAQSADNFESENIYVDETYDDSKVKDGTTVISSNKSSQKMWASVKNAYFRIVETAEEVYTSGGDPVLDRVDYTFYTDPATYNTYAIKINGNIKRWMRLNLSSLKKEGKTPYEAMCEVLDNFFTSGSKIVTNQFKTAYGADVLSQLPSLSKKGAHSFDQSQLAIQYESKQAGRVGQEDADYFEVNVGTFIRLTDTLGYVWENNKVTSKTITEVITYDFEGSSYAETIKVDYSLQHDNVELWKPTSEELSKNFQKVDSIFDL